jgi:hypothetical protein
MALFKELKLVLPLLILGAILFSTGCVQSPSGGPVTTTVPPTTPVSTTEVPTLAANATPALGDLKTQATSLATIFAGEINGTLLATAYTGGPDSTAYGQVVDQLKSFKSSDSRIAYVYTLELQNGTARFVADANYGLPEGSDYLSPYPDAPVELKEPVNTPIGAGPYTDSWGTFVSGYAPVNTGINGTIIVIGVDIRV